MTKNDLTLVNQYGEKSINQVVSNNMPAPTNPAIEALTPIATADANDEATAITLVNECKAKINSIIAALKS